MKLSNDLVSQFVKITNDVSRKPPNTTTFGKIVTYDDVQYVQLDGSDLLTPFDTTVHVKDEERVIVNIKGHGAIVTGNATDPSASGEDLINLSNDLVSFKINTEGLFFEVHNEIGNLNTKFEITAEAIRTELSDTAKGLENKIEITAGAIRTELTDSYNELSNNIEVTAGGIRTELNDAVAGLNTTIETTASGIRTTISDNYNTLNTKIDTTASGIRSEVSKKVDSGQVGTIVTQNAESWGLSINGKLQGTNYTFDGSGFTIGNTNTNSSAKHTTTYSRWNHQDGSYTQVGTSGIYRYISGSNKYYHCLQYTGEYICNSEEQVGITLPSEFQGKNFQVITAVKRIYVALLDYIENARFPLLSFYAEARNIDTSAGYFEIYASIRAWNRTGVSGFGTVVGTNDTANETAALKPVVAYWVYA